MRNMTKEEQKRWLSIHQNLAGKLTGEDIRTARVASQIGLVCPVCKGTKKSSDTYEEKHVKDVNDDALILSENFPANRARSLTRHFPCFGCSGMGDWNTWAKNEIERLKSKLFSETARADRYKMAFQSTTIGSVPRK